MYHKCSISRSFDRSHQSVKVLIHLLDNLIINGVFGFKLLIFFLSSFIFHLFSFLLLNKFRAGSCELSKKKSSINNLKSQTRIKNFAVATPQVQTLVFIKEEGVKGRWLMGVDLYLCGG